MTESVNGIAISTGKLLKGPVVSIRNNVGGTTELPEGRYKVELIDGFRDYETGGVLHGRLTDPEQIAVARRTGEVHQPDWKVEKLPEGTALVATDRVFDPSFVMFHRQGCWLPGANE